jgi:hypothetical protein
VNAQKWALVEMHSEPIRRHIASDRVKNFDFDDVERTPDLIVLLIQGESGR